MFVARLWQLLFAAWVVFAASPTTNLVTRDGSDFVTSQDGKFMVKGKPLRFVGTNAYWLPTLHSDHDIDFTLGNMSSAGIKVVRVWGFNDVETIPQKGTWFQLIAADGMTKLNTGPDGLQKLDTIFRYAKKHKIYIMLTLTNNWNPQPSDTGSTSRNDLRPRNTLSNDYGGMDAYVRRFGTKFHDQFYTNQRILSTYSNYVREIVKRYANIPELFAWELANDPRCYSSLPASSNCTPKTITKWHAQIAKVVKSVDPNHLISSGNQGFLCTGCPKLFVPPPPTPSGIPGKRRSYRSVRKILEGRKAILDRSGDCHAKPINIRGRWVSQETRQNDDRSRSTYDGFHGVDSEDILNIPQIGFSTFQLFPDQNIYATTDCKSAPFNQTLRAGIDWIKRQAAVGASARKPVLLGGFGLLTKDNLPFFVPFNRTVTSSDSHNLARRQTDGSGATDGQRNDAYGQWFDAGRASGIQGMLQYQWTQTGLTAVEGTNIEPSVSGTPTTPAVTGTGTSPNDGYSIQGVSQIDAVDTIQEAAAQFASDT